MRQPVHGCLPSAMFTTLIAVIFCLCCGSISADRQIYSLDRNWRFSLEDDSSQCMTQPINSTFPLSYDDIQCFGLAQKNNAQSYEDCFAACCSIACQIFQWCPPDGTPGPNPCAPLGTCWTGNIDNSTCKAGSGWQSRGRPTSPLPQPGDKCTDYRCAVSTDDSNWRLLNVPHDFVLEGNFTSTADEGHGYLPYGIGWYRRHFDFPTKLSLLSPAAAIWIQFEAIQVVSSVWLNGFALGSHSSGYTPSTYYLNASQLMDQGNVLVVKADATSPDGWWYDGGGIYRHVSLTVIDTTGPYIGLDGIYVPSQVIGTIMWSSQGAPTAQASISPTIEIWTNLSSVSWYNIKADLYDPQGQYLQSVQGQGSVISGMISIWKSPTIFLSSAQLWYLVQSPLVPALYTFNIFVTDMNGKLVDHQLNIRFGIRRTHWDPPTGFYLNDIWTKIKGFANHQDFAGVGVAVPDHLQWYRIKKLKEMNANGWRTAHNAPNPALLDAADELGFLVWDENHRNGQDSEAAILIRRDRNHPSIIIWSICNEALCNTGSTSAADAKRLNALMHSLDPQGNRPVSANNNDWVYADTPLDVRGFDYGTDSYDTWYNSAPNISAISSEASSARNDRDEYITDPISGHVSGYDVSSGSNGQSAEDAWGGYKVTNNQGILTRSFMSGGWTWTGWDYKGEPSPFQWPNINSHFGTLDIAGFPKDRFYWYQTWFADPTQPPAVIHLFPHWNWQNNTQLTKSVRVKENGKLIEKNNGNVDVWVFSAVEEVELFLNGVSLGRQAMTKYAHVQWSVPYVAGEILAVGYVNGVATLSTSRTTTGPPAGLKIEVKDGFGTSIYAKCSDIALVAVAVVDSNGMRVPTANNSITFTVSGTAGSAVYVGGGNGDPSCHVSDSSSTRPAFHGLVLGVIQSGDVVGAVRVTAVADDPALGSASVDISVLAPPTYNYLAWCKQNYL